MFNKQAKHFKRKAEAVQRMIWDLEFKREKTMVIREEVRQAYDNTKSKLHVTENQIDSQYKDPKNKKICEIHNQEAGKEVVLRQKGTCTCDWIEGHMPVDEIDRLFDARELLNRDLSRYEAQMKSMDIDVQGTDPTNDYPEGVEGINAQLQSLRELMAMVKSYLRKI